MYLLQEMQRSLMVPPLRKRWVCFAADFLVLPSIEFLMKALCCPITILVPRIERRAALPKQGYEEDSG